MDRPRQPEPVAYVLYRREHRKGARWHKVATASTRAELLDRMSGSADYHLAPIVNPELVPGMAGAGVAGPS